MFKWKKVEHSKAREFKPDGKGLPSVNPKGYVNADIEKNLTPPDNAALEAEEPIITPSDEE
jgi:hypothetical protein